MRGVIHARHAVERNYHCRTQVLQNHALGCLQVRISKAQILVDRYRSLLYCLSKNCAARVNGFRCKTRAFPPARHPDLHYSRRIGLQQHSPIGMRDCDGMIQHGGENQLKRKLRMQQRCRFKKHPQAVEFEVRISGSWAYQAIKSRLSFTRSPKVREGSKHELALNFSSKPNAITVAQNFAPIDLCPVDDNAAALTAILDLRAAWHSSDHGAFTRDAGIVQSQMVSVFAAPSNEERYFIDRNHLTRPVRECNLDTRMRRKSDVRRRPRLDEFCHLYNSRRWRFPFIPTAFGVTPNHSVRNLVRPMRYTRKPVS